MDAQDIVDKIGSGVQAALKTNQLFLGVEQFEFENADIHPEYVTTVKVAEVLTGPDVVVSLETRMKMLRQHAIGLARINNWKDKNRRAEIEAQISRYSFGKKDSQRIDVLVKPADNQLPPYLIAEAKLGVHNLSGVLRDIDRIVKILRMYKESGLLEKHEMYGAVVFHLMQEGANAKKLDCRARNFLSGISAHLLSIAAQHTWLNSRCGLLTSCKIVEDVSGYQEYYDDGTIESVFGKEGFAFMPGLVLLGNANDIPKVSF